MWGVPALGGGGLLPGVPAPGGMPSTRGVSQDALRQTPLPQGETATAADGTHPTGMHSCCYYIYYIYPGIFDRTQAT